jgi:CMP-N-acetylneuraminic acid synthetase
MALIPAREGSLRVKNKNTKLLGGKPLAQYTLEAAKKSKWINKIVISTNSVQVKLLAESLGIPVPFMRPEQLCGPHSTEFEFHEHALEWLRKHENYIPDFIVNLYPTSPFRTSISIDKAIEKIIEDTQADSLRSVIKCSEHPYKMWTESEGRLTPFVSKEDGQVHTLSYQMLPKVFIQNASIYITKPSTMDKFNSTVGERVLSFEMDDIESIDINNPIDFLTAESTLNLIKSKNLHVEGFGN